MDFPGCHHDLRRDLRVQQGHQGLPELFNLRTAGPADVLRVRLPRIHAEERLFRNAGGRLLQQGFAGMIKREFYAKINCSCQ